MHQYGLSNRDALLKRGFDITLSAAILLTCWWIIALAVWVARRDTGSSGLFRQRRIGLYGQEFEILKIRTMRNLDGIETTVTRSGDARITKLGRFLRRTKIDELPQLWNVLKGDMSFVGPRPDVPGYADHVKGKARIILSVRPGITGPASLKYRNEEEILMHTDDYEKYNREIIFPNKVIMNIDYVNNYSFWMDLIYIFRTISPNHSK